MKKRELFGIITIVILCLCFSYIRGESKDLTTESSEEQIKIKRLAFDAYVKKMNAEVIAEEGVREIKKVKLRFDIDNFASSGDVIYEVTIETIENELRAILLVNPKNNKVKFLIGPWNENFKVK